MKKYWRVIGIAALTAGALYYPAMKLYKYLVKKKGTADEKEAEHIIKAFSPAYRGKHKPHHRHPNGHTDTGMA